MSEQSAIEWTEATWNPWTGCTHVSEGCDNCYMFTLKKRWGQNPEVVARSKTTFRDPLKWKQPKLIFTCSMSDFFHVDADAWRDEAWEIIRKTPHHTYQILTKRPGRIARHLPADWGEGYANVWLGTSLENQDVLHRAWQLAEIPARIRFISAEPLLGPLYLTDEYLTHRIGASSYPFKGLNREHRTRLIHFFQWVIVGGESGPRARPMDIMWARELRDECSQYGVAFFLKQLGGNPDKRGHAKALLDGERFTEMPVVPVESSSFGEPK